MVRESIHATSTVCSSLKNTTLLVVVGEHCLGTSILIRAAQGNLINKVKPSFASPCPHNFPQIGYSVYVMSRETILSLTLYFLFGVRQGYCRRKFILLGNLAFCFPCPFPCFQWENYRGTSTVPSLKNRSKYLLSYFYPLGSFLGLQI